MEYGEEGAWDFLWVGPYSFRNDYMGMNQEFLFFEYEKRERSGEIKSWIPRLYRDNVSFSRMWMKNIWDQQKIRGDFKID